MALPLPRVSGAGSVMSLVRRWATLRGERCLATIIDSSSPYERGQELIVGNRAYVVTRVLRVRADASPAASGWEIWARRRTARNHR
jgi:hypothetical protein